MLLNMLCSVKNKTKSHTLLSFPKSAYVNADMDQLYPKYKAFIINAVPTRYANRFHNILCLFQRKEKHLKENIVILSSISLVNCDISHVDNDRVDEPSPFRPFNNFD